MSTPEPQNISNHAKFVPAFHFFVLPGLALNLIWAICGFFPLAGNTMFGMRVLIGHFVNLLVAIALILLEERLRYQQLLPADLRPRIGEFTINQLVALRFASDTELPALARKVLDSQVNNRKAIKQMVVNWRADYQRV